MAGARLFPSNLIPDIENEGGRWALALLRKFYAEGIVPPEVPKWHYDKIHEYFREGHAEKHVRDIRAMLAVSAGQLNHTALSEWIQRRGLEAEWRQVST